MSNSSSKVWTTIVIVLLIVAFTTSLWFNTYFYRYYYDNQRISQDVARGLTNMVRTYLRTLLESLNEVKSNNWNDLSGKVSWILYITQFRVAYLSKGVSLLINDRTWQQNIKPTLYAFSLFS
jgi:Ca2+/H+ antiporter